MEVLLLAVGFVFGGIGCVGVAHLISLLSIEATQKKEVKTRLVGTVYDHLQRYYGPMDLYIENASVAFQNYILLEDDAEREETLKWGLYCLAVFFSFRCRFWQATGTSAPLTRLSAEDRVCKYVAALAFESPYGEYERALLETAAAGDPGTEGSVCCFSRFVRKLADDTELDACLGKLRAWLESTDAGVRESYFQTCLDFQTVVFQESAALFAHWYDPLELQFYLDNIESFLRSSRWDVRAPLMFGQPFEDWKSQRRWWRRLGRRFLR
jgi:hypothetical protein